MDNIKPIKNFPNYYASPDGKIYHKFKKGYREVTGTKKVGGRYYSVFIKHTDGKRKRRSKARLIYETFVGEIPKGYLIDYKNGLRQDCSVRNLKLVGRTEAAKVAHRSLRRPIIRKRPDGEYKIYPSINDVAADQGIKRETLSAYLTGRRPNW